MAASLQVIYPVGEDTHFDYDYYTTTHMDIVAEHMGPFIQAQTVTKGLAGGPDVPPGAYAIATFTFADQAALDGAMAAAGPALADLPNFTNSQAQMLIGEVIA
ncbi:MAG: EthD family reductase [Rhodobacter sp.]|nr:EthD family reductase [Rhodobacter sp.]